MCLLAIHVSSLVKWVYTSFAPFLIGFLLPKLSLWMWQETPGWSLMIPICPGPHVLVQFPLPECKLDLKTCFQSTEKAKVMGYQLPWLGYRRLGLLSYYQTWSLASSDEADYRVGKAHVASQWGLLSKELSLAINHMSLEMDPSLAEPPDLTLCLIHVLWTFYPILRNASSHF